MGWPLALHFVLVPNLGLNNSQLLHYMLITLCPDTWLSVRPSRLLSSIALTRLCPSGSLARSFHSRLTLKFPTPSTTWQWFNYVLSIALFLVTRLFSLVTPLLNFIFSSISISQFDHKSLAISTDLPSQFTIPIGATIFQVSHYAHRYTNSNFTRTSSSLSDSSYICSCMTPLP